MGRAVTGLLLRLPAFGRTSLSGLLAAAEGNVALGRQTAPGQAGEALLKLDPLTGPRLLPALLLCPTGAEFTPNYLVLPT